MCQIVNCQISQKGGGGGVEGHRQKIWDKGGGGGGGEGTWGNLTVKCSKSF